MKAIIDADGILYRACANVKNETEALNKYVNIVKDYMKQAWLNPKDKSVQFIAGRGNWRKKVFEGYKAHRKIDPTKMAEAQLRYDLMDSLRENKIVISANGCEADDLVRRAAINCELRGQDYVVISADKDLDMVVGKHIRPNQWGDFQEYTIDEEQSDYNYFLQLMIGDMQDNIKSPHLLGKKTAEKILNDNPRGSWRSLVEKEYKDRCGSEWEHALFFTGSLIHIQRSSTDFFTWGKSKKTWWDKKFVGSPSCYKYTDKQLGKE